MMRIKPAPDDRIRVLFCCNPGFYQHLAVTLVSMLENNAQEQFDAHVITSTRDGVLETKLRRSLRPYSNLGLTIYEFPLDRYRHFFVDNHITLDSYLRIFAADILTADIGKILYLDSDLVILAPIRELWETDIGPYALAAVPDPYAAFRRASLGLAPTRPYVNAGVLLLNLSRWREEHLRERLVQFIEKRANGLAFHDQDALNAVTSESILALDYRWNVQAQMYRLGPQPYPRDDPAIRQACREPAIIHYTSAEKPWLFRAIVARKHLYFHYLAKTEWRGAKPSGMAWYNVPEHYLDRWLSHIGIDYTLVVRLLRRSRRAIMRNDRGDRRAVALAAQPRSAEAGSRNTSAADR